MEKIIVFGAGGYAEQLLWVTQRDNKQKIIGFIDETIASEGLVNGLPVRKSLEDYSDDVLSDYKLICAVGNIPARKRFFEKYSKSFDFTTIIDSTTIVSSDVEIGKNVIILGNSIISVRAKIEDCVNINWFCLITHHTFVGEYTNISSGVRLTGNVIIGRRCNVGTNAVVLPEKVVGDDVVIGAGAVVIADVKPKVTVVGVPAKIVNKNI